jgi:hypothetical protein
VSIIGLNSQYSGVANKKTMSLANKLAPHLLGILSDRAFSTVQFVYKQRRLPRLTPPVRSMKKYNG